MTPQDALDQVWKWFVVDGNGWSLRKNGDSAYRGIGGTKDPGGIFIPDDRYVPEMERHYVEEAMVKKFGLEDIFPQDCLRVIHSMQMAHDHYYPDKLAGRPLSDYMAEHLREIADYFGLNAPE